MPDEVELQHYETAPGTRQTDEQGQVIRQPLEQRDYTSPDAVPFNDTQLAARLAMAAKFASRRGR